MKKSYKREPTKESLQKRAYKLQKRVHRRELIKESLKERYQLHHAERMCQDHTNLPNATPVLQCVAMCCSALHCVAACFNVLQHVAEHMCPDHTNLPNATSVLQCVAVCCSVLQCVAVC